MCAFCWKAFKLFVTAWRFTVLIVLVNWERIVLLKLIILFDIYSAGWRHYRSWTTCIKDRLCVQYADNKLTNCVVCPQDTHELFHVMIETLEEESSCYPRVLSLFDVQHLQVGFSCNSIIRTFSYTLLSASRARAIVGMPHVLQCWF